jgi:HupE / UreJ protein
MSRRTARRLTAVLTVGLVLGAVSAPSAHVIPTDATIQTFLKPQGQVMHVIVRVPLASLLDIEWPLRRLDVLDLDRISPYLYDASTLWVGDNMDVYEGGTKLAYPRVVSVRASLPSDRSFVSYAQAMAHVTGPALTNDTDMYVNQGFLDVLFDYQIRNASSRFSIRQRFGRLAVRVDSILHFMQPDGTERTFDYFGDAGLVQLAPQWYHAVTRFAALGVRDLLAGGDYLLFLVCLVIPFRRLRGLLPIVAAFGVACSLTLVTAAYGISPKMLWFPALVELLIAVSIVYLAIEDIASARPRYRWLLASGFGLAFGYSLASTLQPMTQFAGDHTLAALISFDAGVMAGQAGVAVAVAVAASLLFRYVVAERMGTIIVSALVAHTAWHWMLARWTAFRIYPIGMPVLDAAFLAMVLRWAMVLVAVAGLIWLVQVFRRSPPKAEEIRN